MFNSTIPYSVPVAPVADGNNGLFGNDSFSWIIVLLLLFGFGNNGFSGFGGNDAVQRGFDNQAVISKLDGLTTGLCDSTYALNNSITSGFNASQIGVMQGFNGLQAQLADCCCTTQRAIDGVNYNMATQACDTRQVIQNSTRDILESNNANTRAILDFITNDKISTLQAENQNLKLAASQANQNAALMAAMDANTAQIIRRTGNDCPIPAYVVNPPTPQTFYNNCGC